MSKSKTKKARRARVPPEVYQVKLISVPALFGKLSPSGAAGTHELLMTVCGRLRRFTVVGGTRGYGVRLYGDFMALIRDGARTRRVTSNIAFLPDPVSQEAAALLKSTPLDRKADECMEIDCDVWSITDPTQASGYRLVAVGHVRPPPDLMAAVVLQSDARESISPE